jgi:hypothetical protein
MGSEMLREFLLDSQHIREFVAVLFAAVIAPDSERAIEIGERHEGIGLAKGDSVPEEKVLFKVKPMVLAEYHPTIWPIRPDLLAQEISVAWFAGNNRRHCTLDACAAMNIRVRIGVTCIGGHALLLTRRFSEPERLLRQATCFLRLSLTRREVINLLSRSTRSTRSS